MREILNKDNQNLTSNSFLLDDDLRWYSLPYQITWLYREKKKFFIEWQQLG